METGGDNDAMAPTLAPSAVADTVAPDSDLRAGEPTLAAAAATPGPTAPPLAPAAELVPGITVGERYRLVRPIGRGGVGEVWEVIHTVIGRPLALKALAVASDQGQRLILEAKMLAKLDHPGIVDIVDCDLMANGSPYLVMELLRGHTLRELLGKEAAMPWLRLQRLLVQVADALGAAHATGVIHRDLKPANVFVLEGDRCKVIDFGIAKSTTLTGVAASLTRTGLVFGTPAFMSPEQTKGDPVDARTDIYSLGCIAYEMLTGQRPFIGDSPAALLYKQLFEHPAAPSARAPQAGIPPAVDAVIMRCLRKDPALRFDSMQQLRDALAAVGTGATITQVPHEPLPVPSRTLQSKFATVVAPPARVAPTRATVPAGARRRRRAPWVIAGGAVLGAAIAIGGVAAYRILGAAETEPAESVPSAEPTHPPEASTAPEEPEPPTVVQKPQPPVAPTDSAPEAKAPPSAADPPQRRSKPASETKQATAKTRRRGRTKPPQGKARRATKRDELKQLDW